MDKKTAQQTAAANPRILILCDFDGTVSTKDTVNRLVREHATSPEWRYYVKRYMLGEIGSREVYQAVAPLMRMTNADLDAVCPQSCRIGSRISPVSGMGPGTGNRRQNSLRWI